MSRCHARVAGDRSGKLTALLGLLNGAQVTIEVKTDGKLEREVQNMSNLMHRRRMRLEETSKYPRDADQDQLPQPHVSWCLPQLEPSESVALERHLVTH